MQAQVLTLNNANISAQKDNDILSKIKNGRFNVIYSSPEYLQSARGNEMLYSLNGKLTLIAIDEAHVSKKLIERKLFGYGCSEPRFDFLIMDSNLACEYLKKNFYQPQIF